MKSKLRNETFYEVQNISGILKPNTKTLSFYEREVLTVPRKAPALVSLPLIKVSDWRLET